MAKDACIPTLRQHFASLTISLLINNAGVLGVDSLDSLDFAAIAQQVRCATLRASAASNPRLKQLFHLFCKCASHMLRSGALPQCLAESDAIAPPHTCSMK